MSEVTLSVGGREYTVACADGEEAHVRKMGALIDERLQQLGDSLSPQESQNLLFGGLLLADELHETKKSAEEAKSAFDKELADAAKNQSEANLAIGQRDQLKTRITSLESELDGLQSAEQRRSAEMDDIRKELGQRREESQTSIQEVEKYKAQINQLERERNDLQSQIDNKDLLLDRANAHMQETRAKLEEARSSLTSPASAGAAIDGAELVPALDRFADLLETCADKLEGKPAST